MASSFSREELHYTDRVMQNGRRTRVTRTLKVTPEIKARIQEVCDAHRDHRDLIWKVSDLKHGDFSIGKALLMDSGWGGTLKFSDPEQYARLQAYIAKGKKK